MKSPIRSRVYVAPAVATGVAIVLFMGFGMIVSGDEQKEAVQPAPNPLLGTSDVAARQSRPVPESEADAEERTPTTVVRKLTDKQLAVIARGGPIPDSLTELKLSREQLNELLLRELARRWQQPAGQVEAAPPEGHGEQPESPPVKRQRQERDAEPVAEAPIAPATSIDDPAEPRKIIIEKALTEVFAGEPMGAGRMEVVFAIGHGPIVYPDQSFVLVESDQKAHYAAFDMAYEETDESTPYRVQRVEVLFLIRGKGPLELSLRTAGDELFHQQIAGPVQDHRNGQRVKEQWWQLFSRLDDLQTGDHRQLKVAMLDILARRHGCSIPQPADRQQAPDQLHGLEAQFERAIGMLLGIESVKLAMQDDVTLRASTRIEQADRAVPNRPNMRSLAIPSFRKVPIEAIAMHVPEECFYLRTGSVANYGYFRSFLTGWGGNLNDIVSRGTLDHDVRQKIECQLAIDSSKEAKDSIEQAISDIALIGCDPLFYDGAAVGVLFQADDSRALADALKRQRMGMRVKFADVDERRVTVMQHPVSLLSTEDNRVRSFYAIDGQYHLITNSEYLLKRFFEAGNGNRSLGQLREFAYARSKAHHKNSLAFLYLSDPFFQHLISPQYRIEMTRRAVAARELQQIELARLVAHAENEPADSLADLKRAGYLPSYFAKRPDGSQPILDNGRFRDSLRGVRGAFLPVPDVLLDKATATEVSSYYHFVAKYSQQWGRVDPVTVVFSRQGAANGKGVDRVGLEIIVTPYARRRYALLNTHLAEPTGRELTPARNDLLSVRAAVRQSRGYRSHLLSIGIQDDDVPFTIRHGAVRLQDEKEGATFAKTRAYAAITPPSNDVLRTLASVLLKGEAVPPPQPVARQPVRRAVQPPPPLPLPTLVPGLGHVLQSFAWAFSNMPPGGLGAAKYLSWIEIRDNLMIVSLRDEIRDRLFDRIHEVQVREPGKVRMSMRALDGSRVEPYIQAYTFVESRRASTENALLMNQLNEWLRLPPAASRRIAESLFNAKLRCPLGGDYEMIDADGRTYWRGTAWQHESLFELTAAPESWRFPFTDWLRGLDLRFDIDQSTLRAQIQLDVRHEMDVEFDGALVKLNAPEPLPDEPPVTGNGPFSDWILGIRVPTETSDLEVRHVHANSPAARAGINPGDVIRRVNGNTPQSSRELAELIEIARQNGFVLLDLNRQGSVLQLRIPLGAEAP